MSTSSLIGTTEAPGYAAGRDVDALGPSDTSDSGSDIQGETSMATLPDNPAEWGALTVGGDNDSDAMGTGERASASGDAGRDGADILPDRVFDPDAEADGDAELQADANIADLAADLEADGPGEDAEEDLDESDVETDADDVESGGTGRRAGSVEAPGR